MRRSSLVSVLVSMIIVGGVTALPASANGAIQKNDVKTKTENNSESLLEFPALSLSGMRKTHRKESVIDGRESAALSELSLHKKRHKKHDVNVEKKDSVENLSIVEGTRRGDTGNSGNGFLGSLPFALLDDGGKNDNTRHNAETRQDSDHKLDQAHKGSSTHSKNSSETGGLFTLISLPFSWFTQSHQTQGTTRGITSISESAGDSDPLSSHHSPEFSDDVGGFDMLGEPGYRGYRGKPGKPGGPGYPGYPSQPGKPGGPGNPGYPSQPGKPGGPGYPGYPSQPGKPGGPGYSGTPGFGGPDYPNLPGGAGYVPGGAGYVPGGAGYVPGGAGYVPGGAGGPERVGAGLPVSTSPSFADFHVRQLKNSPMTARNEAMTAVQPKVLPQAARVHKDWGQIGGMTPGGLAITEPPSPNNLKTPVPGQFKSSAQTKDFVTVYPDKSPAGFHTEPGLPNRIPYWYTQPAVVNQVDGLTNWFAGQPNGGPNTDYQSGLATTTAAMISAETAAMANYDKTQAKTQAQTQQFGDASNTASNSNLQSGINSAVQSLVNIANENSGGTYGRAVKMVQLMWRQTFLPIAILLVLPGALLTQVKGLVKSGIVGDDNDEDSVSPIVGILRATIAIFLIFATQLIVSYTVDVGNSMTAVVAQQVQLQDVASWSSSQTSRPKGADAKEQELLDAKQSGKSAFKRAAFGFINSLFTNALVVLLAYQTVMICYLYLLGPIAAAFYAWPSTTNALFKNVFSNWINGLISLTFWRFWWSLIILCMCVRIQWLKDLGEYNPNSPWEGVVYTAFVVMLTYVPFMAFEFKPGSMVASLLEKAGQGGGGGGAGGGAGTSGDPNASGAQPPANSKVA